MSADNLKPERTEGAKMVRSVILRTQSPVGTLYCVCEGRAQPAAPMFFEFDRFSSPPAAGSVAESMAGLNPAIRPAVMTDWVIRGSLAHAIAP